MIHWGGILIERPRWILLNLILVYYQQKVLQLAPAPHILCLQPPTAAQGTSSICVHDRPNKLPEAAAARTRHREAHMTTLATLVVRA